MNKIFIVISFFLIGLSPVFAQKQTAPTSFIEKRVTFSIPGSWIVQKQEDEKTSGRLQILIPYPATDNTPHSANATIIANVVAKDVTVKNVGDAVYKNQYPGLAVVNDIADGKNWRTLVWTAKNEVPYLMLDRYGVVNGVAVEFLVGFPLLENGDAKWVEKTVADFNTACENLKIDGTNSMEAKVHLGKIETPKVVSPNTNAQETVSAESAYEKGMALFKAEKYAEAVEIFKQTAKLAPNNANAYLQLGNSYRQIEKFPEAIESYQQALKLKPKWSDALYGLGVTYGMSGSPKESVTYLKESISLDPKYWKAHYNLGVAYADLGQPEEAIASFKEAIKLNPTKDADSFFNLGMSYQQLKKWKEGEDAFAQGLLINPDDAQAHYQIALVYLAMGNRGFATIHYLSLEKLNPELAKKLYDQMSSK